MLDSDLAKIYRVPTKRLNEQLRRNRDRFPEDFAFQLTSQELTFLRSQISTSKTRGGRSYLPWVFTEHGAIMLASVLNSNIAIEASVRVVRAFVKLREMVSSNVQLATKLVELECRLDSHDEAIVQLFAAVRELLEPREPKKTPEIGFHVRENGGTYRARPRRQIKNQNSYIRDR